MTRDLDPNSHHVAWTAGFDAAADRLNEDDWTGMGDELDDAAFPEAFDYALDQLPQYEAAEISPSVHEGISAAYDKFMRYES